MNYRHLTREQRYQISSLRREGLTLQRIAEHVDCHRSTVSRELRRNLTKGYQPERAHRLAQERRRHASARPRISASTWVEIEARLREEWSPEQIAGRARYQRRGAASHERIYQYIAADRAAGGTLWRHRRRRKPYRRSRTQFGRYALARSIHERPAAVDQRLRIGHWELDTMRASSGRAAVVTMVERKSRLIRLVKVPRNTARAVSRAVISALAPIGTRVKSFTMDRGSEFAEHALIESVLAAKAYFADAYCAWQRGSNEQHNGLVRQYLPRRIALRGVKQEQIDDIEDKLNNRPRKTLGYRTPLEVFSDSFNRVALRS